MYFQHGSRAGTRLAQSGHPYILLTGLAAFKHPHPIVRFHFRGLRRRWKFISRLKRIERDEIEQKDTPISTIVTYWLTAMDHSTRMTIMEG